MNCSCPGCMVYGPGSRLWDDEPGHRVKCARLNIDNVTDEYTLAVWRGEIDVRPFKAAPRGQREGE